ncbi:N-acetyldiaminopimelate deacetylase [Halalkalibacter sp. APA_J-10(15)]|uniref:N-acetyldiaminopimelate deacetylase n=1 Tax=unclassified Halalkalibacter TaxID=2893063 RepID=UPI001FF67780|nr:N-acetyldiaminopimelate deacetylase [Halalkalibacter sp. APA_J-10(15)]MCK0472926.1 N-acetyldiaminopimelate deacetylase [Halalkalibacter sp. APA_J-10(15)]
MLSEQELIQIRRELHQIPELGFQEIKTQAYLLERIKRLPQKYLTVETWKTGIFVYVNGINHDKTIAYRADMDGLPIEEQTSYDFKSQHSGHMHACGHDFHMTIAFGVLAHAAFKQPSSNLLFIFQPAEEGPGAAQDMLKLPQLTKWKPDSIVALHIAPEYPVGSIAIKPGLLFANTSELFITLKGKGGHAAYPHTANDMVVSASYLVTQLQSIVARNVDPLDAGVVTIGVIKGGTKQNIIAEQAVIEGTIRTRSIETMTRIKQRIENLVKGIEIGFECEATIDYGANYCQVYNDPKETEPFIEWLKSKENINVIICSEAMTGEDFGYFLEEIPGFMFWLGVDTPYGLHDAKIEPNEQAIPFAVKAIIDFLYRR